VRAYADTSWWVAFKNSSDAQHEKAVSFFEQAEDVAVLWTPWQRVEVYNAFRQLDKAGSLPQQSANVFIRSLEQEIRLGYWPHVEFDWIDAVRTANELSADHSRDLLIRGMDLFHVAIALEIEAEKFLTFDGDQTALAKVAGLDVWEGDRS